MDGELAGLLRACKAEPFDDVRRLVLADWLEEHGDADRAEVVRIQVRLAEAWGDEPELAGLRERCGLLERRNAERWLGPAPGWYQVANLRGGFVHLYAKGAELAAHPPTGLPDEIVPWLEEVCISDVPADALLRATWLRAFSKLVIFSEGTVGERMDILLSNPALEGLASLSLSSGGIGQGAARALARCERLSGLRELSLGSNPLGDEGAAELAKAPWLAGVRRLDLGGSGIGARGFKALFGSDRPAGLKRLDLTDTALDPAVCRALANAPALAGLEDLCLEDCEVEAGGLRALGRGPHLHPTTLDLDYAELGIDGLRALLAGGLLEKARTLHFSSNGFTPEASALLLSSPRLASIEFLRIWDVVGDAGCAALAANEHADRLRYISLEGAGVGPAGAAALGRAKALGALTALSLSENPLGPGGLAGLFPAGLPSLSRLNLDKTRPQARGVEALVGSGMASRLTCLDLGGNRLTDKAARVLARMASGRLADLDLNGNRIGPDGAKALAGSPALAALASLGLFKNRIGDEGVKALVASRHLTGLVRLDVRDNGLTRAGANALRGWPRREQMSELWVEDKGIPKKLADAVTIR